MRSAPKDDVAFKLYRLRYDNQIFANPKMYDVAGLIRERLIDDYGEDITGKEFIDASMDILNKLFEKCIDIPDQFSSLRHMLPKDFIFVCENMPYLARVCMPEKVATDANYVFGMKFGKPKAVFASDIVDTVQSDFDPDNIEEKLHIN